MIKHYFLAAIAVISGIAVNLKAEYLLIYPVQQVSKEAVRQAFKTMYDQQFPTSLSFREIVQSLALQERSDFCHREQAYIQSKISTIDPQFRLKFIPTATYELITILILNGAIEAYHRTLNKQVAPYEDKENRANQTLRKTAPGKKIAVSQPPLITALLQFLTNTTPETIQQLQIEINLAIIEYLQATGINLSGTERAFTNVLKAVIKNLRTTEQDKSIKPKPTVIPLRKNAKLATTHEIIHKWIRYNLLTEQRYGQCIEIFKKTIAAELHAQHNGSFLIFRGTCGRGSCGNIATCARGKCLPGTCIPIPGLDEITTQQPTPITSEQAEWFGEAAVVDQGVSYGNSPLAGLFGDSSTTCLKGACALDYCGTNPGDRSIFYAIAIDKLAYFDDNSPAYKCFNLTNQNTLQGLFGRGEYFHPRTRYDSFFDNAAYQELLKRSYVLFNKSPFSDEQLIKAC